MCSVNFDNLLIALKSLNNLVKSNSDNYFGPMPIKIIATGPNVVGISRIEGEGLVKKISGLGYLTFGKNNEYQVLGLREKFGYILFNVSKIKGKKIRVGQTVFFNFEKIKPTKKE